MSPSRTCDIPFHSTKKAQFPTVTRTVSLTAMVLWTCLLVTTRRTSRFSMSGVSVAAFPVTRQGKLPPHRHVPSTTGTRTGTFGQPMRHSHLVSGLSASAPKKYLTAEDLAGNEGDSSSHQRIYMALSDFEQDVESIAANYVPGPEEFLDGSDEDEAVDGLSATSIMPDVPKTLKQSLQETSVPNSSRSKGTSTPENLDTTTSTSKDKTLAREPQRSSKTTKIASTSTVTTQTYYTAKTASQSPSRTTGKPALTDTFMAGIADPVWNTYTNNHNSNDDYTSEPFSSPAESFREDRTVDAVVMTEAQSITKTFTTNGENWSLLSREEFRSKFALEDQALLPLTTLPKPPTTESTRLQDELHSLQETLKDLDKQITIANNGSPINLSSYKQVSQALFGTPDESTSKDVLEAMAISNILAKLILEHRQNQQRYNKLKKKIESYKNNNKISATTTATSKSRSAASTEPLLLVDTSSLIFRAYFSMPPMHRADGMPVSAVLGFCNLLNKMVLKPLLDGKQPRLVLCCDAPTPASGGPKTWRHELYHPYKANRQEAPMDLIPQFPYFRLAAQAYGMMWIEAPGYEADDVIASLAQKALQEGLTTHIYSSDKDLMQLITNSTTIEEQGTGGKIEMVEPSTMTLWTHDSVIEKWGVPAHQLGDALALAGDTADNIPGVPGIGPKIAAQLLQQFGSLEELLSNLHLIPQAKRREKLELYRDQALLSQQLVQLERNLNWDQMTIDFPDQAETTSPPPDHVADLKMQSMIPDRILRFYDQMGFVTIKERFLEQLQKRPQWQDAYAEATTGSFAAKRKSKWQSKDKVYVPKPEDFDNIPF